MSLGSGLSIRGLCHLIRKGMAEATQHWVAHICSLCMVGKQLMHYIFKGNKLVRVKKYQGSTWMLVDLARIGRDSIGNLWHVSKSYRELWLRKNTRFVFVFRGNYKVMQAWSLVFACFRDRLNHEYCSYEVIVTPH